MFFSPAAAGTAEPVSGGAELSAADAEGEAVRPTAGVTAEALVPVGKTVGIKLFADGVMVIELSQVDTGEGTISPAREAGLKAGDVITGIEAKPVTGSDQFIAAIAACGGQEVNIFYTRDGVDCSTTVQPVRSADSGEYKMGAWIRDSMAGIGTVTFYDPVSGVFGALGHGINDVDTAVLMPMQSGAVMASEVVAVKKGLSGEPGELRGSFDLTTDLGGLYANTRAGVFGVMHENRSFEGVPVPVAAPEQIRVGPAAILANVNGAATEEYTIEILRVDRDAGDSLRDMLIRVTDERLLNITGGIVQGMSGSPIIQDGKLVGAVTHVLVNDPTRGYGIFIENMLDAAG